MLGKHPRVLYLVYWGALEPLGQSLVVPSVIRLAAGGARLTLVTFEKAADRARTEEVNAVRRTLESNGIQWLPLPYHKRPKPLAKVLDFLLAWAHGVCAGATRPFDIVHARTFVGGLMGLPLARLLGAQFVYHNEGFYPDEQVDGRVWQAESLPHRTARWLERQMYVNAAAIIVLSDRARAVVEQIAEVRRRSTPTIVVRSCVDLDRFNSVRRGEQSSRRVGLRLVYLGSISPRYIFDRVGAFVATAAAECDDIRIRVLTATDPALVGGMLERAGVAPSQYSVARVPHEAVPQELMEQDAGLSFLAEGLSGPGGSPTKNGEYWACGLPVVSTANVSDVDAIIRRERVGVIIEEHSTEAYRRAAQALRELLRDPMTPLRCRRAAEEHYSLAPACERQLELYRMLIDPGRRAKVVRT